ncbi:hypothetical protein EHQ76_04400 [Leptospira barantonii]|uniref:Uncharacterized protein n=1 Tax=Leptospira barantonii TaxID=2023184 RepID=A0A5F2BQP9_9LEPT|nr:hypothetical protein [Leptospira barantonii]TGM07866.1 hypothetical protein EHQ76_04400 [Leptospira barantonii]
MRLREFLQRTKNSANASSVFPIVWKGSNDSEEIITRSSKTADNRLTEQQLLFISEYYLVAR